MHRLEIVRHGIAVPSGSPDFEDDQRPLTPKGERRARQIGAGLRRLRVAPDRLLTSPLPRAHRTAELLAEELGRLDRLEVADALRVNRPAASVRDWLRDVEGEEVMIVGHNPTLSDLLSLLVLDRVSPTAFDLKKGAVASLASDYGGSFRLDWLATPRLLRRLGG